MLPYKINLLKRIGIGVSFLCIHFHQSLYYFISFISFDEFHISVQFQSFQSSLFPFVNIRNTSILHIVSRRYWTPYSCFSLRLPKTSDNTQITKMGSWLTNVFFHSLACNPSLFYRQKWLKILAYLGNLVS